MCESTIVSACTMSFQIVRTREWCIEKKVQKYDVPSVHKEKVYLRLPFTPRVFILLNLFC